VGEYDSALVGNAIAKRKPVDSGDERLQLRATDFQRELAPVVALKLQKVERDQRRLSRAPVASQRRKVAVPIRPEDDGLAIDHGVINGQGPHRLRDPQKGVTVIGCVSRPEGDAPIVLAGR
jgi:hypothetical protein